MAGMVIPYRIDRENPPSYFYTPKAADNHFGIRPGVALAISATPDTPGWANMGIVSMQTPFGQGIFMGFRGDELRYATPDEIRAALNRDHPYGAGFRPGSCAANDAGFQRAMGEASRYAHRNMRSPAHTPTPELATANRDAALAHHRDIMSRWDAITAQQIAAILRQIG